MSVSVWNIDRFLDEVALELDFNREQLTPESKLIDDLRLDSLDLLRVMLLVEMIKPGFELPEQFAVGDVTLGDVWHYAEQWTG